MWRSVQKMKFTCSDIGLSQGRLIFDGPPSALTDDIINQIYGSRTEIAVE